MAAIAKSTVEEQKVMIERMELEARGFAELAQELAAGAEKQHSTARMLREQLKEYK